MSDFSKTEVTYTRIGSISIEIGDGVTSFGVQETDLWKCSLCHAVVTETMPHGEWHSTLLVASPAAMEAARAWAEASADAKEPASEETGPGATPR